MNNADYSRRLAALCDEMGWRIAGSTGRDHWRLVKRGCAPLSAPRTPSDWRTIANLRAKMRRRERDRAARRAVA